MSKKSLLSKLSAGTSLLVVGLGIGMGVSSLTNISQTSAFTLPFSSSEESNNLQESNNPSPVARIPEMNRNGNVNFVAEVVQEVGPAVVRINASRTVSTQVPPIFNDPFFRRFFGDQIPNIPEEETREGTGSGFIISADGKILTNAHVVEGASEVSVSLKDGRVLEGQVLGTDALTDLAVIEVDADNLPVARLGNSDDLIIGEWAIAIGNPLGLDNTVTTGIISATGRSSAQIGVGDKRLDFIQTDAAINPGNSGGPLLNAQGEVIAINTAIIRNAQGLGFAIPINRAAEIAEQLITDGRVEHPYIGISMVSITPQNRQRIESQGFRLSGDERGVLVVQVAPNSPGARAGLQPGDIITGIGPESVTDAEAVQKAVASSRVGNDLELRLKRNTEEVSLNVTLGVLPTR
ncbi:trypsin-like peptidase domain-containing protein [Cyanobacterium stanieri LEGE 03274]|uniref:Trypsin-like peptidase domain-containing protein n=1 Tax=Cyanobacterium stanieri LEGE 03274 TaxID=1828756 RepID=A0ABR9V0E1_9CHRO|nr:HhoA/HhoB/HtrA family serine endopeptidase [Cyanobacterium stanieri]MBE9221353.1 trypsin-like peptidase domain-containing protein [Cyanobacterium stanieri LEGE 03274]